jgi:hypothetical protein
MAVPEVNQAAILGAADNIEKLFLDLEGYLRNLALRFTWSSLGILRYFRIISVCTSYVVAPAARSYLMLKLASRGQKIK